MSESRSNMEHLSTSAVVVTYNSGEDIMQCLEALHTQTFSIDQIIVVDNASTDGYPEIVKRDFPEIQLIQLKQNVGVSKARNIGLKKVTSDNVLVVDDDIYLNPDTLEILLETLIAENCSIVCPRIILYPESSICQCDGADSHFIGNMKLRNANQPVANLPSETLTVSASIGACNLIKMEAFHSTGYYNEMFFFYFEDLELSLRMRALGHRIICQVSAIVLHNKGAGTPGLSYRETSEYPRNRAFHTIRNRWLTILLIYRPGSFLLLLPSFILFEISTLVFVISRGWLSIWIKAIQSAWELRKKIADGRRFIQSNRIKSDFHILTGGSLTLSPGLINNKALKQLMNFLSFLMNINWKLISPLIK